MAALGRVRAKAYVVIDVTPHTYFPFDPIWLQLCYLSLCYRCDEVAFLNGLKLSQGAAAPKVPVKEVGRDQQIWIAISVAIAPRGLTTGETISQGSTVHTNQFAVYVLVQRIGRCSLKVIDNLGSRTDPAQVDREEGQEHGGASMEARSEGVGSIAIWAPRDPGHHPNHNPRMRVCRSIAPRHQHLRHLQLGTHKLASVRVLATLLDPYLDLERVKRPPSHRR